MIHINPIFLNNAFGNTLIGKFFPFSFSSPLQLGFFFKVSWHIKVKTYCVKLVIGRVENSCVKSLFISAPHWDAISPATDDDCSDFRLFELLSLFFPFVPCRGFWHFVEPFRIWMFGALTSPPVWLMNKTRCACPAEMRDSSYKNAAAIAAHRS